MRTIALFCPLILGSLASLTGCLEAHQGNGGDAAGATEPRETNAPHDTVEAHPDGVTTTPPDTTAPTATTDTMAPDTTAPDTTVADTTPADTTPPDDTTPADTTATETTTECVASGGECESGGTCCEGLVCVWQIDHYMLALCEAPLANGAACVQDANCTSGHCVDGICADAPACEGETTPCWWQGECCEGLVCTGGPYIYGECMRKQPLHAYCEKDNWCESGLCQDSECVSQGCLANGIECSEGECCSGICHWDMNSYAPPHCIAAVSAGYPCDNNAMCDSGSCTDGYCASKACQSVGDECYFNSACCAGEFCTNDGISYTPGQCLGKRGDGGWCEADNWCRSGKCLDGMCAAAD